MHSHHFIVTTSGMHSGNLDCDLGFWNRQSGGRLSQTLRFVSLPHYLPYDQRMERLVQDKIAVKINYLHFSTNIALQAA